LTTAIVYRILGNEKIKLADGQASLQIDAEQAAAKKAILLLNSQGYKKDIPKIYADIKNIQTISKSYPSFKIDSNNINTLQTNQHRIKTQIKYLATPLCFACKTRDKDMVSTLLNLKADPSIYDIYNMSCFDLLFINSDVNIDSVKSILQVFQKFDIPIIMHKNIFDFYFSKYLSDSFFSNLQSKLVFIDESQESQKYLSKQK
jgi:ankyrin repeat protein